MKDEKIRKLDEASVRVGWVEERNPTFNRMVSFISLPNLKPGLLEKPGF